MVPPQASAYSDRRDSQGDDGMRGLTVLAALLLAMAAALPAWAGDAQNCDISVLIKTEPARVVAACRRLADHGVVWAQFDLGEMYACLLYTSDAADEEDSVDLG